jgi:hypothetical protein
MKIKKNKEFSARRLSDPGQSGSAIVIALFVLALVSVFAAYALSRTASEALAIGNEVAESQTQYAAQGSLEKMTRDFNKVFESKLSPGDSDLAIVRDGTKVPGLSRELPGGRYSFLQTADRITKDTTVTLGNGTYAGLVAIRDGWRLRTTATDINSGIEVELTRNILNNRIPIFQFGIFYDDDLELFNGPRFQFGGRVHSNRHFFLHPSGNQAIFDSKITAYGYIVTQRKKNGDNPNASLTNNVQIRDGANVLQPLGANEGSVLDGASPNVFGQAPFVDPSLPSSVINSNWDGGGSPIKDRFDGNVVSRAPKLNLPMKVAGKNSDLIELVKRGKNVGDLFSTDGINIAPVTAADADNDITSNERYANKAGIRISLADSKAELPGCASGAGNGAVAGFCGVRLDGHKIPTAAGLPANGAATDDTKSRGYQPLRMKNSTTDPGWGYLPTRVNGERLAWKRTPCPAAAVGCEVWIKVETVEWDANTQSVVTKDITQDFLSLGVTEQATPIPGFSMAAPYDGTAPNNNPAAGQPLSNTAPQVAPTGTDSRSIIKLQRFYIRDSQIPQTSTTSTSRYTNFVKTNGTTIPSTGFNYVEAYKRATGGPDYDVTDADIAGPNWCAAAYCSRENMLIPTGSEFRERYGHLKRATINGRSRAIVPFPIQMFDAREGFYFDDRDTSGTAYYDDLTKLPRNGVMSLVDIDVANLRRFFRGDFNGLFPSGSVASGFGTPFSEANGGTGLRNSDIPQNGGWVVYVSDRRGDVNFDGELDMEDVYGLDPGNNNNLDPGEDLDFLRPAGYPGRGVLDGGANPIETAKYNDTRLNYNPLFPDQAAVWGHDFYRRGVRLINGSVLPGVYDSTTPANTRGFTLASENGVYVQGDYNATGAALPGGGQTPYTGYFPQNTPTHIPASIAADAVTILSNAWDDGASFRTATVSPYSYSPNNGTDNPGRVASETTIRFAMLSGDTITTRRADPHQGGSQSGGVFTDARANGGVHNFKRFLENWSGVRLNYSGSLINLFNSRNNNGTYKCCVLVYGAPTRNWVFDATFLDPGRIPPGTPFFQYVQTTGFERSVE